MFFGLFGPTFAETTHALYGSIVAEARRPAFYIDHAVPDTTTGRFDMMVLVTALVLRRLRDEPKPAPGTRVRRGAKATDPHELGHQLLDLFFTEMDRALRETGVGDVSVGKRIKKLAAAYNGRAIAYDAALDAGDDEALAAALARNLLAGLDDRSAAPALAVWVRAAADVLSTLPVGDVLAGRIPWPAPAAASSRTTP